ncbi:MAG: rubrerythrin family protein [Synergistota bacterium]|nr:rubrerythrin family protein [Synergistota bacterium]
MGEKTMANLAEAFSGESQANRKYLFYSEVADKEGVSSVAKLFRAAAAAETLHAKMHYRNMGKICDTETNLKDAIAGETYEYTEMYPPFIDDAEAEGEKKAHKGFSLANEVEKVHAELYKRALDHLSDKRAVDYYLCTVCGHIEEGAAPDKCPVCGASSKAYELVE